MRIASFKIRDQEHLGFIDREEVIDLNAVDNRLPRDLADLLRTNGGELTGLLEIAARASSNARFGPSEIEFGLPVVRPSKVLCLGLNYMKHLKEGGHADQTPNHPTVFLRCLSSLAPHNAQLLRPIVSETFDAACLDA